MIGDANQALLRTSLTRRRRGQSFGRGKNSATMGHHIIEGGIGMKSAMAFWLSCGVIAAGAVDGAWAEDSSSTVTTREVVAPGAVAAATDVSSSHSSTDKAFQNALSLNTEEAFVDYIVMNTNGPNVEQAVSRLTKHTVVRSGGIIPWSALGGMSWSQPAKDGFSNFATLSAKRVTIANLDQLTFNCSEDTEFLARNWVLLNRVMVIGHLIGNAEGLRVESGMALLPPRPPEMCGIGTKLKMDGAAFLVELIAPGGGADKAGVPVGSEIVAIDGKPVKHLTMPDVLDIIGGPTGTLVSITVVQADGSVNKTYQVERIPGDMQALFCTIGARLTVKDGSVMTAVVSPGGGADKAGAPVGSQIESIDGKPVKGMPEIEAFSLIYGQEGTVVSITVLQSQGATRTYQVERTRPKPIR